MVMAIGLDVRHNQSREEPQSNNRMERKAPVANRSKEVERVLADLKANRVSGVSEVGKTERLDAKQGDTDRTSERPTRDRYVPETAEDRASFGHYQMISDGDSVAKVRFDAPSDGATAGEAESESADSSVDESVAKNSGEGTMKPQTESVKVQESSANVAALRAKQKTLEKQLKSISDAESRKEIKKKLEQIKRQIKAAEH